MELAQVVRELAGAEVTGPLTGSVTGIVYDSTTAVAGSLFVAITGRRHDGYDHIPEALRRGARAVVGERQLPADFPSDRAYIRVPDARQSLGLAAAAFYEHPTHAMEVIGVTGTDGKTTTTNLVEALLAHDGRRTGLMSTVDFKIGDRRWQNDTRFTTLEAPEVQALLREMASAQVSCAIVETTSSGLALHRVTGVEYDVAVVTNITSEHLEVHGTLERYRRAKAMLCEAVNPELAKPLQHAVPRVCVLNRDDSSFEYLRPYCRAPVLAYGIDCADADVRATALRLDASGTHFTIHMPDGTTLALETPMVGRFNVSNCLAAVAVAFAHGLSADGIVEVLAHPPRIPGRMERVQAGQPFAVVVDYAHTADSLEKVLQTLRPLTSGRLIVVFGSAGDRDRVKRPQMGAVAARLADFAVITDEDPREEDAASVLREIAQGAEAAGAVAGQHFIEVVDRRKGIAAAFARAQPNDTVLLAGKGHEQSIIIGTQKRPWDDPTVARELLSAMGYAESASPSGTGT